MIHENITSSFFIRRSAFDIIFSFVLRISYFLLGTLYHFPLQHSALGVQHSTLNKYQVVSIKYQDEKRILVHTSPARRGGYFVFLLHFPRRIPEYGFVFSDRGDHYGSSAHTGPFSDAHP